MVVIYGDCLGGGFELVMVCMVWVVTSLDKIKMVLFEVMLGLFLGVGGIG